MTHTGGGWNPTPPRLAGPPADVGPLLRGARASVGLAVAGSPVSMEERNHC